MDKKLLQRMEANREATGKVYLKKGGNVGITSFARILSVDKQGIGV